MRLIDADRLLENLRILEYETDWNQSAQYGIHLSSIAVDNASTIDPVKHGRWVHESLVSTGGGTYAVVRCSRCKSQFPLYETTYCPNCGARMDGGTEDVDG